MKSPFLKVDGLSKVYPGSQGRPDVTVFEDVSFGIEAGEFVCILGHSGCGKTTILNILAGLDEPTGGVAIMAGRELAGPSLDRGVVFQGHALLPWLSALGNVVFGVRSRWPQWSRHEAEAHSRRYLEGVGLAHALHKKPAELSGGMKQRVGIARAFAIQPRMLLLDEPFGALDALTRGTIQDELLEIVKATRQTVFMITHDVDEAILLADRIILMSNGPHAQIAEFVDVTLPRERTRETLFHDPEYYRIRNHLMDFLVRRSMALSRQPCEDDPVSGPAIPPASPFIQSQSPGDLSNESRRDHRAHPAGQAGAQADVGRAGADRRPEQGVDHGGTAGPDDLDGTAGQGGGRRARAA